MKRFGKQPLFSPKKVIAIGDTHGEDEKLKKLLNKIPNDKSIHVVFIGDLLGSSSSNINLLKTIKKFKEDFPGEVFVIEGNHDRAFLELTLSGKNFKAIKPAIQGLFPNQEISPEVITPQVIQDLLKKEGDLLEIFKSTIPYYETENLLITHAPINSSQWVAFGGKRFWDEFEEDDLEFGGILDSMAWELRTSFQDPENLKVPGMPKFLICGHQFLANPPERYAHKAPRVFSHRAYLDCGCGYRDNRDLFALEFPSKKIINSK